MPKTKSRRYHKPKRTAPIEPVLEVAVPATLPRKFDRPVAVEVVGLLLMPLVAFWVMRFIPINQNNFLDPYVYTGYIHDFKDLIARYGLTYYSVRFGMIIPAQAFAQVFGPVGGYFAFRYVLALSAGISLYYMAKRQFSQPIAAMAVVGLLTSPYFARALLWDYPDAAGVPYLGAAVCLFLLDERPSLWRDALAGAFTAMAVNSNFFEVALVGIFGVFWLFFALLFRRPLKQLVKRVAGVALGGLVVCALGCVYYWHAFGKPTNIFYPTLGMAYTQATGGAKQWRTSGFSWIQMQIQVLMPVFLAVCCLLVIRCRRVTFTSWVVVSFGFAVVVFFYAEQFLLGSNVLQFFYYFSYFIPAVFLMLAYLWQTLWERTGRRTLEFVVLGLTALLTQWVLFMWGWALPNFTVARWLALGGTTAVVLFISTREWRSPLVKSNLSWLALVSLSGFFSAGLANYGGMMRTGPSTNNIEMDVYRVAVQFMRVVPKPAEHPGVILFWYNNRVGNSINSVQSTHLWGYSKLNTNPPEDPGLPHLNDTQAGRLRDPQIRYLALLGETEDEVSQGLATLTKSAIEFKTEDHRVLASGDYRIFYQLVELTHK